MDRLAQQAVEAFGRIDTWINCAAVAAYGTIEQMSIEELRRVVDIDFFGQVYGARAALPHLKHEGAGALIFVGSVLSDRAVPLQGAYSAAKHALKAFTESLRAELAHEGSGVQVTLVKPASINTPLFDHALSRTGRKARPVSPVYEPGIVADALLHCAEHRQREVTVGGAGQLLTLFETFAGPLLDRVLAKRGFEMQQTQEPKSPDDAHNLYEPVHEMNRIEGNYPGRSFSVYTWARTHPIAAASVVVGGVAAAAEIAARQRAA